MEIRGMRMIRMKCLLLMAVLLMIPHPWAAAQEEYIFGGSKNEILNGVAVSEDDRILMTGYTASSDGTLAGRTKEGHSGWALCVDRNGNVLFSFCSRRGSQDEMEDPVFHEDGTATVLLNAYRNPQKQMELIRLDRDGNVLNRKILMEITSENVNLTGWTFGGGYGITRADVTTGKPQYTFYDWDGNTLLAMQGERDGALAAIGGQHAVVFHETGFWLSRIDGQGNETRLAYLYDAPYGYLPPQTYGELLSLEDGSCVAVGRAVIEQEKGQSKVGACTRWTPEGQKAFELYVPDWSLERIVKTANGYAILATEIQPDYADEKVKSRLFLLDEEQRMEESVELPDCCSYRAWDIGALRDGTLIVVQNIINHGETDAMMIVVDDPDAIDPLP